MPDRLDRWVLAFNAAVVGGDWAAFAAGFTEQAQMRFAGVPYGPFRGRTEIAAAYAARPPDEQVRVMDNSRRGAVDIASFSWASGATGVMRLTWDGESVDELEVAFDT